MQNLNPKLKLNLPISKSRINTIIVVIAGLLFFGVVVFVAITYLRANDEGVGQLRLEVQAESKTYRKSIFLANNSLPQNEPTPTFTPTPTPEATPTLEVDQGGVDESIPTPTEDPLLAQVPTETEPTPSDIVVATPSVEVPTPTEEVLLADSGSTPTPVSELPDAGFVNNYIILLIISSFIIFIALFI
ncbi:MAG: hypothetical protein KatS3mg090_0944 [Patescibacteria group bacterium]|nr:MAG: hypothetical protein KatS3mg090_0944 [Patescibacteria group bacterium]